MEFMTFRFSDREVGRQLGYRRFWPFLHVRISFERLTFGSPPWKTTSRHGKSLGEKWYKHIYYFLALLYCIITPPSYLGLPRRTGRWWNIIKHVNAEHMYTVIVRITYSFISFQWMRRAGRNLADMRFISVLSYSWLSDKLY